jgi:hypothetical protein
LLKNEEKKLKWYSTKTLPVSAVPWSFKFIDKELQTQLHASAAGPNPVAQKWKKKWKNAQPRHCRYRQCLGLQVHWKRVANTSPSNSCWAISSGSKMKKKLKWYSPKTLPVPAVPKGFKFIAELLQTRAHQWAARPNRVAEKRKKKFKKKKPQGTAGTGNVCDVKFIEKDLHKQVHPSTAGPNPVAQKWKQKTQVILNQDTAGTGNSLGLQVHWKWVAITSSSISGWAISSGSKMKINKSKRWSPRALPVPVVSGM